MKIEIENYRGQTIEYDIENDKFICDISIEDQFKQTKRSSLKDVRKEIDTFIKLNLNFKPFKAIFLSDYKADNFSVKEVEAIRTDGKYIVSYSGSKSYLNQKQMENCMNYDPEIIRERELLEYNIKMAHDRYREAISRLCKKLTKMDLSKYDKIFQE